MQNLLDNDDRLKKISLTDLLSFQLEIIYLDITPDEEKLLKNIWKKGASNWHNF